MQSTRKIAERKIKRDAKDDTTKKVEEKNKKPIQSVSTPRNFIQKSSIADIYSRNTPTKAPKKSQLNKTNNTSPMKDVLKSSPSSVSQNSTRSFRINKMADSPKVTYSARSVDKKVTPKNINNKTIPNNVTINSPIPTKKNLVQLKKVTSKEVGSKEDLNKQFVIPERKRTNTRTLDEEEIKVLTPDVVDNNAEMLNLTKKLSAKPKAFYVDLGEEDSKVKKQKSSDEEFSYEDDFESYESDFDSYHSEDTSDQSSDIGDVSDDKDSGDVKADDEDGNSKEERMLDSGNFELRDPRSSKTKPMDFISEVSEEGNGKTINYLEETDKKVSLTDEGFQDMSSGLSSIKTIHIDILDRPLFIDFTKSRENRRKRRIFEKLKQRAKDILSMVTLHEMSFNLFEMAPIPYDVYMATFGRTNYTQTAVQTFDDGITEEIQTDEVSYNNKWSQFPVEFSDKDICLTEENENLKKDLDQFTFFSNDIDSNDAIIDDHKNDPLRIYLEQKDGAGSDKKIPIESYKIKLKNNAYNVNKLKKFLKKFESRISSILSVNSGNTEMSNLIKTSKFPFSTGYMSLSMQNIDKLFLKNSKIIGAVMSETKNNLIITIHEKFSTGVFCQKCVLCLWDTSVAIRDPLKILIATDNIKIGRFRGSTDGYFVGALDDGSIHLWDLSEKPTWCNDVALEENSTKLVEIESKNLTEIEKDREWNLRNSSCISNEENQCILQASSYTSSALSVCNNETVDGVVGLEFTGNDAHGADGRKILCQICSLNRRGVLIIWSIVQEKSNNTNDKGKALWSKLKLERNQTININEYINVPIDDGQSFNLNAAKKRLSLKRQERNLNKISRQKSVMTADVDRPSSAASVKNKTSFNLWEDCVEFNHLKIMNLKGQDNYLIAKDCGEVLCCRRVLGTLKMNKLCVSNAASSITRLESSPHGLPYFLAATDCGTVNLCSLLDYRVLLTLDCRNGPNVAAHKYHADHKGRFIGTTTVKSNVDNSINAKLTIKSIFWSHTSPFCISAFCDTTVCVWELTHSDIRAKSTSGDVVECCATGERTFVLLKTDGDIQIYKQDDEKKDLNLFEKYISLL